MAYGIKVKLEGLEDVLKRLGTVRKAVQGRIVRKALEKATKPILSAAKAKAPKGATGLLRKSLGRKAKTYRRSGTSMIILGPRTGFAKQGKKGKKITALGKKFRAAGVNPSKYAHLVEKGTKPHSLGKGSQLRTRRTLTALLIGRSIQHGAGHPGTKAQPFLAPAWAGQKAQAEETIRSEIEAGILAETA